MAGTPLPSQCKVCETSVSTALPRCGDLERIATAGAEKWVLCGTATTPAGELAGRQDEPACLAKEASAGLTAAALQARAVLMFSGVTGAPVASGEAASAQQATRGLLRDAVAAVDKLPSELFDKHAKHRPCGLLDKYEAVGMLIGDAVGLPLLPAGPNGPAHRVGKRAPAAPS